MILKMMETGPLMVNTYIVGDEETKEAAVFDPGGDADAILSVAKKEGLKIKYIINTHAHFDHVGGNQELQGKTGAPIIIHQDEAADLAVAGSRAVMFGCTAEGSSASEFVEEGDTIEVGSIRFKVVDLRGHSKAGQGFVFEGVIDVNGKREKRKIIICGDALFSGSIGRTDFPGGNLDQLLENIRQKIFTLPDNTLVLSGHGPVTTVGREKQHNPFF
ncbi:MAG: beta-lactamase domain protein [Acidobacteria bacterium]|nr:beta-lactamase domain protein [Acidobacteriota bacterium]